MKKVILIIFTLTLVACATVGEKMDARYWNDIGLKHGKAERYGKAEEAFKKAISIDPSYVDAYNNIGRVYLITGHDEEAIDSFKTAVELKPTDLTSLYNLAEAYARISMYEQSIETLKRALEIKLDDPQTRFNLGAVYMMKGDRASAMEEYKILRRIDPERAKKLWDLILR